MLLRSRMMALTTDRRNHTGVVGMCDKRFGLISNLESHGREKSDRLESHSSHVYFANDYPSSISSSENDAMQPRLLRENLVILINLACLKCSTT